MIQESSPEGHSEDYTQTMAALMPCFGLLKQGQDDASELDNLQTCREKVREEIIETDEVLTDYIYDLNNLEEAPKAAVGKDREAVLEEIWDAITALYTMARVIAPEKDCLLELSKVNIKNELRGYHHIEHQP